MIYCPMVRLLQERFDGDPYRSLIVSMLLVRTQGKVVSKVYPTLFSIYPTIKDLANAKENDLCNILRPLGLQNIRSKQILRAALHIATNGFPKTNDALDDVPFVGKYVSDAYAIFILGSTSVKPYDKKLRHRLKEIESNREI